MVDPHVDADDADELALRIEEGRVRAHVTAQGFLHRMVVDGGFVKFQGVAQGRVRRVVGLHDRVGGQIVRHRSIQVVRTQHEVDLLVVEGPPCRRR